MTSQPATLKAFTDAAAASVARVIADVKREAAHERSIREAEHRAGMAELQVRLQSVADLERRLTESLGALKDGEPGTSITVGDVMPAIVEAVSRAVAELPGPKEVSQEDINLAMSAQVGRAVAAEVERVVATLPPAEPGKPGVSVTLEDVAPMISEAIERAVSAIPPPKDGDSVTADDVRPMIEDAVERAVSALPAPEPGKPGKLPVVRAWEDGVHYESDVVTFDGRLYQAARDTGKAPPHEDWTCLVERGTDGNDGRSFRICGTYREGGEYQALDVVALNGASFAARNDHPGVCPGNDWQMIAAQGKRGEVKKGDAGKNGSPVVRATVDGEGLLTLLNGDGTRVDCDLYPLLSKLGR